MKPILKLSELKRMKEFYIFYTIQLDEQIELTFKPFSFDGDSLEDVIEDIKSEYNFVEFMPYRDWETDRKSTRLNSSHSAKSRMPSSA